MDEAVRQYYGEVLQTSADLKTNACCSTAEPPTHLKPILGRIHDEVLARYYGCGLIVPEALEGLRILDLGCGAGRDCYVLAALAGPAGRVVGVDMTAAQLAVARRHREYHAAQFGHAESNVEFIEADLENLVAASLPADSFDLIVSNCVINLVSDKRGLLSEAYRLLRDGGEIYFADIYADRRVPAALHEDSLLRAECLAGALYWNDFLNLARDCGFTDPRLVADRSVAAEDPNLASRLGNIRFHAATFRLWKLPGLEPACEDYGQAVRYRGTVTHHPDHLRLDKHHMFPTGRIEPVCGNTFRMVRGTRLARHFDFYGEARTHFGIFPGCGLVAPFGTDGNDAASGGSACC